MRGSPLFMLEVERGECCSESESHGNASTASEGKFLELVSHSPRGTVMQIFSEKRDL